MIRLLFVVGASKGCTVSKWNPWARRRNKTYPRYISTGTYYTWYGFRSYTTSSTSSAGIKCCTTHRFVYMYIVMFVVSYCIYSKATSCTCGYWTCNRAASSPSSFGNVLWPLLVYRYSSIHLQTVLISYTCCTRYICVLSRKYNTYVSFLYPCLSARHIR